MSTVINALNFDDIKVSTKTIIGISNLEINLEDIYKKLPITPYEIIKKRRGRKRKNEVTTHRNKIDNGSIITLKYQGEMRGVDTKNRKKTRSSNKYFRNAVTVVMKIGEKDDNEKFINFKISHNGKFQMTGCKSSDQAQECIKYIWKYINESDICTQKSNFKVIFRTVMTNIDFNLGFTVNRENLDKYLNTNTMYNSLLETSFGYTGVNIKMPFNDEINSELSTIEWDKNKWKKYNTSFRQYLDIIPSKDRDKELSKQRYVTFLVFQSGNVIMSGLNKQYMSSYYKDFFKIINNCIDDIVEKLD